MLYEKLFLLKTTFIPTKSHWHVELKLDYTSLCLLYVGMVNPRLLLRVPFCTRFRIPLRGLSGSWGIVFLISLGGLSGFRVPPGLLVPAHPLPVPVCRYFYFYLNFLLILHIWVSLLYGSIPGGIL